jgi:phytoene dehydrogenase-like protein
MKAAIIGAGLGGLALELRLRRAGWEVVVCEAGPALGGKMNRWQAGGYLFDTGPSVITMPLVFAALYAALGERMEEHLRLAHVDPHARYVFADGASATVRLTAPDGCEPSARSSRATPGVS